MKNVHSCPQAEAAGGVWLLLGETSGKLVRCVLKIVAYD